MNSTVNKTEPHELNQEQYNENNLSLLGLQRYSHYV